MRRSIPMKKFLACAVAAAWVLFGAEIWESLRKSAEETEENDEKQ